jgi:hypothetical protein
MRSAEEVTEVIVGLIKSNEDSEIGDFQEIIVQLSWKRQFLQMFTSNSQFE